jgi:outer membrane protein, heavy metal efflux system
MRVFHCVKEKDMKFHYWMWIAALPSLAGAQPLNSLVEEALRNNREILAAQKRAEAARQRPAQASSLPEPMVSLGYTSVGGPWPGAGLGREVSSNAGLMISQEAPFPGKRKLRGEIAAKEAGAEFQQYLEVRLSVEARLRQAYHELHHARVGIEFVRRYQGLLETIIKISEARYSVGRAMQQDIFKAQTQLAVFEAQLLRYQRDATGKEIEINALLNRPQNGHIDTPEDMTAGELPATLEEMLAHARTQSPMLARERANVEGAQLSTNLARKEYYPDYVVSGGYFNQGGMAPMWQFRVDFKLPAYFWGKQRAMVNEKAAELSAARRDYESVGVSVEARIRDDYAAAQTARKLVDLYQKAAIPEAQLALESSRAGYETGTLDFLSVFSNFMSVVDYEMMYHEEVMRFHVALARLGEMTGMELEK